MACPSDANATATACSANSCVISGCSAGFSVNAAGTTCVMTGPLPIFSGAPLAIVRPADADRFGCSVSLSGDGNTLAVGDYNGGSSTNGSATVYTRSSGAWSSGTGVSRPTGAENFGYDLSLSLDGNTLVVGNVGGSNSYGAAIVYTRNSGTWGTGTTVARPSGATDYFGAKVSLSGDGTALVVGGNGSATVYTRSNGTWSTGTNISPPNGTRDFGSSVSLSQNGNTLVVGDYSGGAGLNGSATAYARNNGTWSAGTNITRPIDVIGNFGIDVSLSGDSNTLVVGSEVLATVYTRSGANWNTGTNVTRPSAASVAFGTSVALSTDGNTLVVGDYTGSSDMHGSATVYTRAGGSWSAGTNVTRPDDGAVRFGTSVALSGDGSTLVVVDYDSVVYVYTR